jgi:hypothetical protein
MWLACSRHNITRRGLGVCTGLQDSQSNARSLISHRVPPTWNTPARLSSSNGYPMVSPLFSRRTVSSRICSVDRIDEETLSDYEPARYCPIAPGSILDQSYTALVKLGYGRTSTTWLCKDSEYVSSVASNEMIRLTFNSSAYKVLKVGAADATNREKRTFEKIGLLAAHSEHPGSICVRQSERVFEIGHKGYIYNCFVFEPLGSNLLEYTNRPSNRAFGSQNVRFTAVYLLHAMNFLHTNGIAHTGKLSATSLCSSSTLLTTLSQTSNSTTSSSRSLTSKIRISTLSAQQRKQHRAFQNSVKVRRRFLQVARCSRISSATRFFVISARRCSMR